METVQDGRIEAKAEIFKAIGHPTRLRIVECLADGERSVSEIVQAVQAEQSNVSRHLSLLRQARVLTSRKSGLSVFYRVSCPELREAIGCMLACAEGMVRKPGRVGETPRVEIAPPASASFSPV
jgi:ArsR family transcriptional regulator